MIISRVKKLYHVSSNPNLDGEYIKPGIPNNMLTLRKFEDTTIPRVELFSSVSDAISSQYLGQKLDIGTRLYVYSPGAVEIDYLLGTSLTTTPYALLVDEKWYTLPLRVKKIGEIEIVDLEGEEIYHYGSRSTVGKLYRWKWREILKPWERGKL